MGPGPNLSSFFHAPPSLSVQKVDKGKGLASPSVLLKRSLWYPVWLRSDCWPVRLKGVGPWPSLSSGRGEDWYTRLGDGKSLGVTPDRSLVAPVASSAKSSCSICSSWPGLSWSTSSSPGPFSCSSWRDACRP